MTMKIWQSLVLVLLFCEGLEGKSPSTEVSEKVWDEVKEYMIPDQHPAKGPLEKIFSKSRVFSNFQSMEAAGFESATPQHHTQIIVTRHPKLSGYVIKAYLDIQKHHEGKPEHYFWVKRCIGARLLENSIQKHGYGHLLKVPKKWIYMLPDKPKAHPAYKPKRFILIEEDMDIYDNSLNEQMWGRPTISKELLKALFTVITEYGFHDCAKPANCPFSKDGRVALVDTQTFHKKNVAYKKLTPYLATKPRAYWKRLISKNRNGQ